MKIACVADLHGFLPEVPEVDLLIIAGDITPLIPTLYHLNWLEREFARWLEQQPPAVVIAGNHDRVIERRHGKEIIRALPCIYLENEAVEVAGIKIWGSPYTPPFFNWAFMAAEEALETMFAKIPKDTELLVTHGPPRGILDPGYNDPHVGSTALLKRVNELPNLRMNVFGHLHEGRGITSVGKTTFVNASYVNDGYQPYDEGVLVVDWP